ncbi:MAG: DUF4156 domain-containing protein [Gammaproteobacteria bacterium]
MQIRLLIVIATVLVIAGCSWVKLTPGGEKVRILTRPEVANCKKLGKTNVSVTDKVIGLQRNQKAIQENLNVLARNAAAGMGGDSIVPENPPKAGVQTFAVYRCTGI